MTNNLRKYAGTQVNVLHPYGRASGVLTTTCEMAYLVVNDHVNGNMSTLAFPANDAAVVEVATSEGRHVQITLSAI